MKLQDFRKIGLPADAVKRLLFGNDVTIADINLAVHTVKLEDVLVSEMQHESYRRILIGYDFEEGELYYKVELYRNEKLQSRKFSSGELSAAIKYYNTKKK